MFWPASRSRNCAEGASSRTVSQHPATRGGLRSTKARGGGHGHQRFEVSPSENFLEEFQVFSRPLICWERFFVQQNFTGFRKALKKYEKPHGCRKAATCETVSLFNDFSVSFSHSHCHVAEVKQEIHHAVVHDSGWALNMQPREWTRGCPWTRLLVAETSHRDKPGQVAKAPLMATDFAGASAASLAHLDRIARLLDD